MKTHHTTKPASFRASLRKKLEAEETKEEIEDHTLGNPAKSNINNTTMDTSESFDMDSEKGGEKGPDEIGDDLDEKSEKKEGPHKKNVDFEDVAKTGRWGAVSNFEVFIVTTIMVVIAVGVTITLVIFLEDGNDETDDAPKPPPLSKLLKPSEQMTLIRMALNENPVTEGVWDDLGDDIMENPYRMAAAWIVEEDDLDREADILPRFALATMYYSLGGNEWSNSTNWLTSTPLCEGWFGVNCDNKGNVVELELTENNLKGEIPLVLVFLEHLKVLWLNDNQLEGQVPTNVFPRMESLEILYMQLNSLTGPIPDNFLDNGQHLRKLHQEPRNHTKRCSSMATASQANSPRCTVLLAGIVLIRFSVSLSIAR
eukprot:scaffold3077_cov162-Amphora_coffeaeformis.AAC.19